MQWWFRHLHLRQVQVYALPRFDFAIAPLSATGLLNQRGTHKIEYNPNLKFLLEASVKRFSLMMLTVIISILLLAACGVSNTDAPVKAVEDYLNTLVAKDDQRLPTLVCGDWEEDALIELDSFQAVTARLEDVSCKQTGADGDTSLVLCNGKIIASYNNEDQELDLSTRTYQVIQEGGDWLVCGTR